MATPAKCIYLSHDTILHVLDMLYDDYGSLYQCSLVNWEFNKAASRLLYSRIQLSPPSKHMLYRKFGNTAISEASTFMIMFVSACTVRNAPLVIELEISGHPSSLWITIANAVRTFVNLSSITLTPSIYDVDEGVLQPLIALKDTVNLHELTVNSSCMTEVAAPLLVEIENIHRLTLHGPSRAILDIFPEWLRRLSNCLTGLHLKDNCGSITPGVLKSLIPYIQNKLLEFTLGLSYSLTNDDVFSFLAHIPHLKRLQLQYYLASPKPMVDFGLIIIIAYVQQLRGPSVLPNLQALKYFAANHSRMRTKREVVTFCKWVRTVISASSIEHIRLVCDEDDDDFVSGANVCFGDVINHIAARHSRTLRKLDFRSAYIGVHFVEHLFRTCKYLEEFHISSGKQAIFIFQKYSSGIARLHTAGFEIRNIRRGNFIMDAVLSTKILADGPPSLRRLIVNGVKWEATWVSDHVGNVHLVVGESPKRP